MICILFAEMSLRSVFISLVWSFVILDRNIVVGDVESEDFVSERDCPFSCTCIAYDVNCTNTNLLPDIPEETEGVFIINSTLDFVPINAFLNLPKLQEIYFINSKITKLRACSMAELVNMTTISFENTEISQIEGNAFSNLINITSIKFSGCKIGEMFSFSFHNLRNVQRFDIFDTTIMTVHPYAFFTFESIDEIGIMGCTIQKFLRDGFSRFSNIEMIYMLDSTIKEWHCGSLDTVIKSGIDLTISTSSFTCDCKLAWLWTKHRNSTVLNNRTNKCAETDSTLPSTDINQVCPDEKSRDNGCTQLHPSTPHTCSRAFDSPKIPVEKVTYPNYFAKATTSSSVSLDGRLPFIYSMILFLGLLQIN